MKLVISAVIFIVLFVSMFSFTYFDSVKIKEDIEPKKIISDATDSSPLTKEIMDVLSDKELQELSKISNQSYRDEYIEIAREKKKLMHGSSNISYEYLLEEEKRIAKSDQEVPDILERLKSKYPDQ